MRKKKRGGPGREEREHFKNLGDWFGPVDKVRIEKLIANIRNGRIPCEEDKRGYIKNYRIAGCELFFFSKLFAFQTSENSNLSKNDAKCQNMQNTYNRY